MVIDYQRLLPVLKQNYSDRFPIDQNVDEYTNQELQSFVEKNFTERELVENYAEMMGMPFMELIPERISKELFFEFPEKSMQRYRFVPFEQNENEVSIAMSDPYDYTAIQAVKFIFRDKGLTYKTFVATDSDITKVLSSFQNMSSEVKKTLAEFEKVKSDEEEIQDQKENKKDITENIENAPIIKVVSVILKNAVEGGASDIHIEGTGSNVRVRFRVDGILHTSLMLPKEVYSAVVARIKILSNLKIDEQRKPQDGRFSIIENDRKVDFRVSTFPTEFGEKVVLRILDTSQGIKTLDKLGFIGPKADLIKESIEKPYGMILVTGPTGSGKSTTLYTLLSLVNNEEINIVTLEDPVEYFISGVNQSQVKPEINYTFASGLRSILRQDPDIIMVGEIRDGETASLAVQSSLTGHLVFSTLHTNDAPGAIPRLMDMGVESFLLAASLEMVIAQRLVRKLCDKCKKPVPMDQKIKTYFENELKNISAEYKAQVYQGNYDQIYEPVGCEHCKNGFKGRMAIFEIVPMTEKLQALVEKDFSEDKVREYLLANDFVTLKQDGLFKALNGYVSLEELLTVVEQ